MTGSECVRPQVERLVPAVEGTGWNLNAVWECLLEPKPTEGPGQGRWILCHERPTGTQSSSLRCSVVRAAVRKPSVARPSLGSERPHPIGAGVGLDVVSILLL